MAFSPAFALLVFVFFSVALCSQVIPNGCQKEVLLSRLEHFIEADEPIAFRIVIEQECRPYINFADKKSERFVYQVVPKILESSLATDSREQMLTSFARLGCYLPFHRALYKSSALQPVQIWRVLKDTGCAPNSFYLNVIAQKYPEDSTERDFIVEWMLEGLKQGLRRAPSPERLPSSESLHSKEAKPLLEKGPEQLNLAPLKEAPSSVLPLEFGYLRGDANWKDGHVVIKTKNIKGPFRFMGFTSILNESYMALFDNINRLKESMEIFTKLKSLRMAMNGKLKLDSSFGFVRLLTGSWEIEALLFKDIKLIVLSRDENDTMQYVYPPNPYIELKRSAEELQYVKLSVKPTDIVLLVKRQSFLPPSEPIHEESAVKELKPHDLCGVFYFCELKVFDQLFRLLTKHIHDRTQALGLLIVGGFVYTPSSESKNIIKLWNQAF